MAKPQTSESVLLLLPEHMLCRRRSNRFSTQTTSENISVKLLYFSRELSQALICRIITALARNRQNESLKKTSSEKSNTKAIILQKSCLRLSKDCAFIGHSVLQPRLTEGVHFIVTGLEVCEPTAWEVNVT